MSEETKEFSTVAIASLSSGTLLCKFGEVHEAAEFLMGHPIWTHHFAELWHDIQRTILAQHPSMPTDLPGVTKDNYREHVERLEREIGASVRIQKGSGLTAMLPTDGIPDHLKDKTIIVKV
jgi:hypothetical protein